MQMLNETVRHKVWGTGIIIGVKNDGARLTVHFDKIQADKSFEYPGAFEKFLVFENDALQAETAGVIANEQKNMREEKEKERQADEKRKEHSQHPVTAVRMSSGTRKKKQPQRKNPAFKLNFCDGGASRESVGYNGVCSDAIIRYNILEVGRAWCRNNECPCRRYLDGNMTRRELDENFKTEFTCYESIALQQWIAQAGWDLKGSEEGRRKARRLPNIQPGSLAVLTTRYPGTTEAERVIIGVFIIDTVSEGNDDVEGTVSCRSRYRMEIRPDEVNRLKFWNYYRNEDKPDSIRWGTGLYRYVRDESALALLQDIVDLKRNTDDYDLASEILHRFEELVNGDGSV